VESLMPVPGPGEFLVLSIYLSVDPNAAPFSTALGVHGKQLVKV